MHKIVNGEKVDLSEDEIIEFKKNVEEHNLKIEELAKTKYLEDRKLDPNMPSDKELLEALWNKIMLNDDVKATECLNRINEVNAKFPPPTE